MHEPRAKTSGQSSNISFRLDLTSRAGAWNSKIAFQWSRTLRSLKSIKWRDLVRRRRVLWCHNPMHANVLVIRQVSTKRCHESSQTQPIPLMPFLKSTQKSNFVLVLSLPPYFKNTNGRGVIAKAMKANNELPQPRPNFLYNGSPASGNRAPTSDLMMVLAAVTEAA